MYYKETVINEKKGKGIKKECGASYLNNNQE